MARLIASFSLAPYDFPATARVVVEAQAGWTVQRFEFGAIGDVRAPRDTRLSEFSSLAGLMFRLKIVGTDDSEGRLLGEADRLRPSASIAEASQRSFIVVRSEDLGQVVWRVDIDEGQPLLLVNSRLGDHHEFLRRKEVMGLVLPAVLQQVLVAAIETGQDEDDPSAWETQAIRFGERLTATTVPPSEDEESIEEWVEAVVAEFSRKHRFLEGVTDWLGGEPS